VNGRANNGCEKSNCVSTTLLLLAVGVLTAVVSDLDSLLSSCFARASIAEISMEPVRVGVPRVELLAGALGSRGDVGGATTTESRLMRSKAFDKIELPSDDVAECLGGVTKEVVLEFLPEFVESF